MVASWACLLREDVMDVARVTLCNGTVVLCDVFEKVTDDNAFDIAMHEIKEVEFL